MSNSINILHSVFQRHRPNLSEQRNYFFDVQNSQFHEEKNLKHKYIY